LLIAKVLIVRMHLALKAYNELLNCVSAMDQSSDTAVRSSAQVIKGLYTCLYIQLYVCSAEI